MALDTNKPAQYVTTDITLIRDLTKDKLCEILTANTESLNRMVARYNAVLLEKAELKTENDTLKAELQRISRTSESVNDIVDAFMKALADNDMTITIKHECY